MAWIQDGGSNPWYANFNNTALDFITFNGVQVWASSYSFSITVSCKVGTIDKAIDISDPSECEAEWQYNILTYVSRFSVSVSNVVGCDKIIFYPMGSNGLAAMKFDQTGLDLQARWSNRNDYYNIETNSDSLPTFFIDHFYLSNGTNVPFGTGYALYEWGGYYTRSSLQSDPSIDAYNNLKNTNRALKYYWSTNLPGSYYYEKSMDTARQYRWELSANDVTVPLVIIRGSMSKNISAIVDLDTESNSGWMSQTPFVNMEFFQWAERSFTASNTEYESGAWA